MWVCDLIRVSLGNVSKSLALVMTEGRQSGGGSAYFVYFICFFQGTLQMEREKKVQRNFFYLSFIFQAHGHISVVAMCKAKNGALKKRKGLR